jgi:hypothetical protein
MRSSVPFRRSVELAAGISVLALLALAFLLNENQVGPAASTGIAVGFAGSAVGIVAAWAASRKNRLARVAWVPAAAGGVLLGAGYAVLSRENGHPLWLSGVIGLGIGGLAGFALGGFWFLWYNLQVREGLKKGPGEVPHWERGGPRQTRERWNERSPRRDASGWAWELLGWALMIAGVVIFVGAVLFGVLSAVYGEWAAAVTAPLWAFIGVGAISIGNRARRYHTFSPQ